MNGIARSLKFIGLISAVLLILQSTPLYLYQFQPAYADSSSAGISYRSNTGSAGTSSVKYREWNAGTLAWGSETELTDLGSPVRAAWIEYSPISTKRVIIAFSDDGTLNSFTCSSSCSTASSWVEQADFADVWGTAGTTAERPFDFKFEQTSGDLIIVYDKESASSTQELFYRVMKAGSNQFGSEQTIDDTTSSSASDVLYPYIRMATNQTSGSNVLGMIAMDETSADTVAWRWNGDSWVDQIELTTDINNVNREEIAVAFERSSGNMLVFAGEGADIRYREYTTSWQTAALVGGVATGTGNVHWIVAKPTPQTSGNDIILGFSGSLTDFATIHWTGSAWSTGTEHDAAIDTTGTRPFDIGFSPSADGTGATVDAIIVWGTASGTLSYRRWTLVNTFSTAATFTETSTHAWVSFSNLANPTSGDTVDILGGALDDTFDLGGLRWDGGTNNAVSTGDGGITADTVTNSRESFKVAHQLSTTAVTWDQWETSSFTNTASTIFDVTKIITQSSTWEAIVNAALEASSFQEDIETSLVTTVALINNPDKILTSSTTVSTTTVFDVSKVITSSALFSAVLVNDFSKVIIDSSTWSTILVFDVSKVITQSSTWTNNLVFDVSKVITQSSTWTLELVNEKTTIAILTSTITASINLVFDTSKVIEQSSTWTLELVSFKDALAILTSTMTLSATTINDFSKVIIDSSTWSTALVFDISKIITDSSTWTLEIQAFKHVTAILTSSINLATTTIFDVSKVITDSSTWSAVTVFDVSKVITDSSTWNAITTNTIELNAILTSTMSIAASTVFDVSKVITDSSTWSAIVTGDLLEQLDAILTSSMTVSAVLTNDVSKVITDSSTWSAVTTNDLVQELLATLTSTITVSENLVKNTSKIITLTSTWSESVVGSLAQMFNINLTSSFTVSESIGKSFTKVLVSTAIFGIVLSITGGSIPGSSGGDICLFELFEDDPIWRVLCDRM